MRFWSIKQDESGFLKVAVRLCVCVCICVDGVLNIKKRKTLSPVHIHIQERGATWWITKLPSIVQTVRCARRNKWIDETAPHTCTVWGASLYLEKELKHSVYRHIRSRRKLWLGQSLRFNIQCSSILDLTKKMYIYILRLNSSEILLYINFVKWIFMKFKII